MSENVDHAIPKVFEPHQTDHRVGFRRPAVSMDLVRRVDFRAAHKFEIESA